MTDDGNMMDVADALYKLRTVIDDLDSHWLDRRDLRDIEQSIIRLHNLVRKHRSK